MAETSRVFGAWSVPAPEYVIERRVEGLEVLGTTITVSAGRPTLIVSPGADETLERKVQFLVDRDRAVQSELGELWKRLDDLEAAWAKRLATARGELEARFAQALKAALEEHRPLRILGVFALVGGLVCVTLASLP